MNASMRTVCLALICALPVVARAQSPTARIVRNANAFLATLEPAQKQRVLFAFDDDKQRVRWSNLPNRMVQRAGLSMGELTPAQRSAATKLLASALSPRGFEKVQQIVEGDEVLKRNENNNPMFGRDLFFVSILGTPSETAPWMLQFGGHHLALNITIVGAQGVLTPSLTAAQPALYTENGKTVRPLGAESDKAFALLNSLDSAQRAKAILNYRVADLVLGPGQDGKTIQPEGLKATSMNEGQRAMLVDLIAEWSGIVHESAAAARMAEIMSGLNDTWFAWSGSTTHAEGHAGTAYYRIQGPALVIEYAPQPLGGDPTNHIHTIYRDPTNDYGRKLTSK
ncbi:MAG TPA: DUF3500 domain-containing protein [Gemmatimonadaceae bacterium]